jgi:hypothetical protein
MRGERTCQAAFNPRLKMRHHRALFCAGTSLPDNESNLRRKTMNMLRITAVAIACTIAPVAALAQTAAPTPANKVDCEKAKMKWDEKGGKDGKGACIAAPPAAKK